MRASGASGVSNEMQEVRARVIHLQRLREREGNAMEERNAVKKGKERTLGNKKGCVREN